MRHSLSHNTGGSVCGSSVRARCRRSISDDPSAYRPKEEVTAWPLGDPILRLKAHLIAMGHWSEERHTQAEAEIRAEVVAAQMESEAIGKV